MVDHIILDYYLRAVRSYLLEPLYFWGLLLQQLNLYPSLPVGLLGQDLFQRKRAMERAGQSRLRQSPWRVLKSQKPERHVQTWVARCGIMIENSELGNWWTQDKSGSTIGSWWSIASLCSWLDTGTKVYWLGSGEVPMRKATPTRPPTPAPAAGTKGE